VKAEHSSNLDTSSLCDENKPEISPSETKATSSNEQRINAANVIPEGT